MELLETLLISFGLNFLAFIPAYFFRTDKFTDITYALSFVFVTLYSLLSGDAGTAQILLAAMIFLWALRLGSYLLIRINKIGRDKRFDQMRDKFFKFAGFWLIQAITVWIVLFPTTLFFENDGSGLNLLTYIGFAVWAIGLAIETIADWQKFNFKNNKNNLANRTEWIQTGLWKYSRHPNYLGEIMLWFGVYIFTLTGLNGLEIVIGLVAPVFLAMLIIFVSGIPLLEKKADERWGDNPEYLEYKKRTGVLVPFV